MFILIASLRGENVHFRNPLKDKNGMKATACAQKVSQSVTSPGLSEDVRVYSDSQLPILLLTVFARLHSEGCATFS